VEELDECRLDRPVIFSAHGVPKSVPAEARAREMIYVDATCPLVSKVHVEAERHFDAGREIVLIGHAGHPEVIGTMGQLPPGSIRLLETVEDAENFQPARSLEAFVRDADHAVRGRHRRAMVAVLQRRFPVSQRRTRKTSATPPQIARTR
jgi:4-hydroxy-3-methylbut-2-enyl diphosphate reductase